MQTQNDTTAVIASNPQTGIADETLTTAYTFTEHADYTTRFARIQTDSHNVNHENDARMLYIAAARVFGSLPPLHIVQRLLSGDTDAYDALIAEDRKRDFPIASWADYRLLDGDVEFTTVTSGRSVRIGSRFRYVSIDFGERGSCEAANAVLDAFQTVRTLDTLPQPVADSELGHTSSVYTFHRADYTAVLLQQRIVTFPLSMSLVVQTAPATPDPLLALLNNVEPQSARFTSRDGYVVLVRDRSDYQEPRWSYLLDHAVAENDETVQHADVFGAYSADVMAARAERKLLRSLDTEWFVVQPDDPRVFPLRVLENAAFEVHLSGRADAARNVPEQRLDHPAASVRRRYGHPGAR